ncbi:hypothetical protein [Streptomyces wedmorensis]
MGKATELPAGAPDTQLIQVWAQALFCSPLHLQDPISADTVWATVADELTRYAAVPGGCAGAVAQRAGDYPELFTERMTWCLEQAACAFAAFGCDECQAP